MTLKKLIIGSKGYLARNLLLENPLKFDSFDVSEKNSFAGEKSYKFHEACEGTESIVYLSHQPRLTKELDPKDYLRIAESRAKAMVDVAKKSGVKRLIFSGSYWQEPLGNGYQFLNYYSKSKQLIQEVFEENASIDFKVISMHLFDLYGPGDDRDKLIPKMLESWRNQQPLVIHSPVKVIVPIHIRDVLLGLDLLLDEELRNAPDFKIVSLSGNQIMTVADLVENFGRVFPDFRFSFFDDGQASIVNGYSRHLPPNGWRALIDIKEGLSTLKSL